MNSKKTMWVITTKVQAVSVYKIRKLWKSPAPVRHEING